MYSVIIVYDSGSLSGIGFSGTFEECISVVKGRPTPKKGRLVIVGKGKIFDCCGNRIFD